MKQWEMDLYTALLNNDPLKGDIVSITRDHPHFETPIGQEKADLLFEHIVLNNIECLTFLQKTNHPSLPVLKLCIKMAIDGNIGSPTAWNWISDELNRWVLTPLEIKTIVKPMRLIEKALDHTIKPLVSYRCTRALRPYLEQKEIDVLTLFARSSGHTRASCELLKHADLQEVEKQCQTYSSKDIDLEKMQEDIVTERSKRTKNVLNTHLNQNANANANAKSAPKRKM